jgi:hypothetical protein
MVLVIFNDIIQGVRNELLVDFGLFERLTGLAEVDRYLYRGLRSSKPTPSFVFPSGKSNAQTGRVI